MAAVCTTAQFYLCPRLALAVDSGLQFSRNSVEVVGFAVDIHRAFQISIMFVRGQLGTPRDPRYD